MTTHTKENEEIYKLTLRMLKSPNFMIATSSILNLYIEIEKWMTIGDCGAIIYGRTRTGKTSAINFISQKLRENYGKEFPVDIWTLTDHVVTDKSFYASMINAMDIAEIKIHAETAITLKERVVNYMRIKAASTPFRRIILMIDEAWKLAQKEFDWLMDLYNTLNNKYDIQLNVFLFGTKELLDLKKGLLASNQHQILERFMLNEYHFYGIKNAMEIGLCLLELNKTKIYKSDQTLAEYFFPDAYKDNNADFYLLAEDYWSSFEDLKGRLYLSEMDIPMMYFMKSFMLLMYEYGSFSSNPSYFIDKKSIIKCIEETGYGKTSNNAGRM